MKREKEGHPQARSWLSQPILVVGGEQREKRLAFLRVGSSRSTYQEIGERAKEPVRRQFLTQNDLPSIKYVLIIFLKLGQRK